MKKTIHHIGIAVRDIDSTIRFYENCEVTTKLYSLQEGCSFYNKVIHDT